MTYLLGVASNGTDLDLFCRKCQKSARLVGRLITVGLPNKL